MKMPELGTVISARITRSSNSCVTAESEEYKVFVDRAEFFWVWPEFNGDPDEFVRGRFPVGSVRDIFVMRYMYPLREVLGSFRRVNAEANPYRRLSREQPDKVHEARVTTPFGFAGGSDLAVSIYGGLYATVPDQFVHDDPVLKAIPVGSTLSVVIEHLDLCEPTLVVRPVGRGGVR